MIDDFWDRAKLYNSINLMLIHNEFDPGSERTLAACLTHASRTRKLFGVSRVAHG